MKKITQLFIIFIFAISFLFITRDAQASCLTMKVSMNADGTWAGGNVAISCQGDSRPNCGPGGSCCKGDSDTISPGETKTLTSCSCPAGGGDGDGCIHVDSVPDTCTAPPVGVGSYCGMNGDTIDVPLTGACEVPEKSPTPGPSAPPASPTPGPACNTPCTGPRDCEGAKDGCTTCVENGTTRTCQVAPTPTPRPTATPTTGLGTPTPPPATTTPTPTTGIGTPTPTQAQATPTPTSAPTATLTPTRIPGTPTPTPPVFSRDMCKCDGASITPIVIGSPATFTAFGKVEGIPAIGIAQIKSMNVSVYKEGIGTFDLNRIIGPITVNATQVEKTATKARYKIEWPFVDTAKLEKNTTYRIAADVRAGCVRQQTALIETPQQVVLAATAEAPQPNFFDVVRLYISGLFGGLFGNPPSQAPQPAPQPTSKPSPTKTQESDPNLQLKTIYPATILRQSCDIVFFRTGE